MEQSTAILIAGTHRVAEGSFHTETPARTPFGVVKLLTPSARWRVLLRAQVSCVALIFAALAIASAYILIPLAMTVHFAVHPVLLAVVIAAAALTELALIVTMVILKTEGPSE
jgi:hypothetical protein